MSLLFLTLLTSELEISKDPIPERFLGNLHLPLDRYTSVLYDTILFLKIQLLFLKIKLSVAKNIQQLVHTLSSIMKLILNQLSSNIK